MPGWRLKAVVQKTISYLPFSKKINYAFQKYVTRGVNLTADYFEDRLGHCRSHIEAFARHSPVVDGFLHLELGTGWYPVVPLGMFLCGARSIITVDLSRLMDRSKFLAAVKKYTEYQSQGKLKQLLPYMREERMARLQKLAAGDTSFEELLKRSGINYLVADARKLPLEKNSADLITSNNTFEHIYPDILKGILQEFKRISKKGGVQSHFIDMSDHFAHLDRSITIYNYLQFSPKQWGRIDNSIQPQNRMRITHYRKLYADLGIPINEEISRPGSIEDLRTVKIDNAFNGIPEKELAVSHALLVSKM